MPACPPARPPARRPACLTARLYFRMEQVGSHRTDFRKSVEKIQIWLKRDKNKEYFTWRPVYIYGNTSLNSI